ncbi:MAG: hypothetical protein AAF716_07480 [Cyanobacteria bacterium P01_D01_bin.1]
MKSVSTYPLSNRSLSNNQAYWPLRSSSPLSASPQRSWQKGLSHRINNLLRMLLSQMSGGNGPFVWQTHNADGQAVWNAEDRVSGKSIHNVTESELRVWLETRYQF